MSGFCIFVKKQSLFLLFWTGMANLIECSFKMASCYGDIFGTLYCELRGGWHGRRECLGFAEKEIEKKRNTRSQISWNNSCDRNGERRGSTETKNDFLLGSKKKETEEDKYIRAKTNGPLCRQFNSHTVWMEANIASVKLLLWAEVGLSERKSDLDFFEYSAAHCWTVPQLPFFQDFLEGNDFFPLCQERVQTKRGILDQVHVPVAFVFHGDLPRILCQREELAANQHSRLIAGLQAAGQRAAGRRCQLCSAS